MRENVSNKWYGCPYCGSVQAFEFGPIEWDIERSGEQLNIKRVVTDSPTYECRNCYRYYQVPQLMSPERLRQSPGTFTYLFKRGLR